VGPAGLGRNPWSLGSTLVAAFHTEPPTWNPRAKSLGRISSRGRVGDDNGLRREAVLESLCCKHAVKRVLERLEKQSGPVKNRP
jgi:hypothetical protein